jgi:hypothetical protein
MYYARGRKKKTDLLVDPLLLHFSSNKDSRSDEQGGKQQIARRERAALLARAAGLRGSRSGRHGHGSGGGGAGYLHLLVARAGGHREPRGGTQQRLRLRLLHGPGPAAGVEHVLDVPRGGGAARLVQGGQELFGEEGVLGHGLGVLGDVVAVLAQGSGGGEVLGHDCEDHGRILRDVCQREK